MYTWSLPYVKHVSSNYLYLLILAGWHKNLCNKQLKTITTVNLVDVYYLLSPGKKAATVTISMLYYFNRSKNIICFMWHVVFHLDFSVTVVIFWKCTIFTKDDLSVRILWLIFMKIPIFHTPKHKNYKLWCKDKIWTIWFYLLQHTYNQEPHITKL